MGTALSPHDDTAEIPVVSAPAGLTDVEIERARHAAPPAHHGPGWWALRIAREAGIVLAIALLASVIVRLVVGQAFFVPSASMEDTLRPGDRILVGTALSRLTGISRGDIVVFRDPGGWREGEPRPSGGAAGVLAFLGLAPAASGDDVVTRIIAVGGDRIACCSPDGRIVLNGAPLDEPYLKPGVPTDQVTFDVVVPPRGYFVMGDNRSDSRDSRYHLDQDSGAVPSSDVIGRALVVLWPPAHLSGLTTPAGFARVPDPAGP